MNIDTVTSGNVRTRVHVQELAVIGRYSVAANDPLLFSPSLPPSLPLRHPTPPPPPPPPLPPRPKRDKKKNQKQTAKTQSPRPTSSPTNKIAPLSPLQRDEPSRAEPSQAEPGSHHLKQASTHTLRAKRGGLFFFFFDQQVSSDMGRGQKK